MQVWDFKGRELKSRWEIGCAVVKIVYHRSNGPAHMLKFGFLFHLVALILSLIVHSYFAELLFDIIFRSFSYCN